MAYFVVFEKKTRSGKPGARIIEEFGSREEFVRQFNQTPEKNFIAGFYKRPAAEDVCLQIPTEQILDVCINAATDDDGVISYDTLSHELINFLMVISYIKDVITSSQTAKELANLAKSQPEKISLAISTTLSRFH